VTIGAGDTLLHYRVVEKIGAGGMGEVYSAEDTRLGRSVAIKLLPAELRHDPLRLARLAREARLLASLNHPSIATLHGLEESADGTRFLVMELVEGETLASRLQRGPVPLRDLYSLGAQIAEALAEAHGCGITHRDLKPGNIMLTRTGVKLLDFGLAKAARPSPAHAMAETQTRGAASERLTGEGALVGTFHYMAPEQLEGRDADARSDIWALGAVLHEMATGQPPFTGGTAASIIAMPEALPGFSSDRPMAAASRSSFPTRRNGSLSTRRTGHRMARRLSTRPGRRTRISSSCGPTGRSLPGCSQVDLVTRRARASHRTVAGSPSRRPRRARRRSTSPRCPTATPGGVCPRREGGTRSGVAPATSCTT
jgi:serine/threonine protein kinase